MNAQGRKLIQALISTVEEAHSKLSDEVRDELAGLAEEEREKFDNMSEGLQATERGQEIGEAADALEEAALYLDQAFEALDKIIEQLKTG
jgi:hypothetical protein